MYALHDTDIDKMNIIMNSQSLRNWPQPKFKIAQKDQSLTEWNTVSTILRDGVGRSTLPCVKLRAIVDSAKEVIRLHNWEHKFKAPDESAVAEGAILPGKACCSLGADDFLPIFIFCVVRAELERPCALGENIPYTYTFYEISISIFIFIYNSLAVLLTSLCQASKMIGETGYYLASFEAALEHIKEMDLSDYIEW